MKDLIILSILAILILSGCVSESFAEGFNEGFNGDAETNNETSTESEQIVSTNNVASDKLITLSLSEVMITHEEMDDIWHQKNSWDEYTYNPKINTWSRLPDFEVYVSKIGTGADIHRITIEIRKYADIDLAKNGFEEEFENKKESNEKQEIRSVGNESFGAIKFKSKGCGGYFVSFRRNNFLVNLSVYLGVSECPGNELKGELQDYSIIIDNKIQ